MKRGWVIAIIVVAVLVVAGVVFMSITRWGWGWTGAVGRTIPEKIDNQEYVPGKTLWDLLELLIVPAALAITALWFSNRERRDDREIAKDRQRETALQAYYDKMTELLLENNLREATLRIYNDDIRKEVLEGKEVISLARSRTLATLISLDGVRKGLLIRFLYEAKLIEHGQPIIHLDDADLKHAGLSKANLKGTNLSGADLSDADLSDADLCEANLIETILSGANLSCADLKYAYLREANLSETTLEGSNLSGAHLSGAKLVNANLNWVNLQDANLSTSCMRKANLSGASLEGASLLGADLRAANLSKTRNITGEQLAKASYLKEAIMPDGKKYDPAIHTELARLRKEEWGFDGEK